jgi:hypothetical protein
VGEDLPDRSATAEINASGKSPEMGQRKDILLYAQAFYSNLFRRIDVRAIRLRWLRDHNRDPKTRLSSKTHPFLSRTAEAAATGTTPAFFWSLDEPFEREDRITEWR